MNAPSTETKAPGAPITFGVQRDPDTETPEARCSGLPGRNAERAPFSPQRVRSPGLGVRQTWVSTPVPSH